MPRVQVRSCWRTPTAAANRLPVAFWHLSIAGSLTLLAYALHRGDVVFTIGQGAGVLIYARNLQLMRTARRTLDPVS